MDEAIFVLSVDKLPPSWKDFKHTLKYQKEELALVQLGSHLHIEESLRAQENDKPKGKDVVGSSSVNMVEHRRATKTNDKKGKRKVHDNKHDGSNKKTKLTCWKCGKSSHFKRDCRVGKGGNHFKNTNGASGSGEGSKDHNPNKEFTYGKTISLSNVLYVSKLHKNLVSGPVFNKCGFRQVLEMRFQLYIHIALMLRMIQKFDEAMKSQDVAFWKEAINDEMDSIIGNNAWVLADLPPGCKALGCKWIFKKKMKVDGTIEKFKQD
ncbi:UNVERIFIED_CONTAM: hypothetical protein Sangu_2447000 [Sesamum angustifolium]|uniref:CCHC-type domain-containing protein n=1 Tax=Sesamum angustifolium TaxID=2727405 RepID=A0AAW2KY52_9LAMI